MVSALTVGTRVRILPGCGFTETNRGAFLRAPEAGLFGTVYRIAETYRDGSPRSVNLTVADTPNVREVWVGVREIEVPE